MRISSQYKHFVSVRSLTFNGAEDYYLDGVSGALDSWSGRITFGYCLVYLGFLIRFGVAKAKVKSSI